MGGRRKHNSAFGFCEIADGEFDVPGHSRKNVYLEDQVLLDKV